MAYVSIGAEGDWRTDEAPYKEAPGQTHKNKDGTDCYVWSSGYCTELYSVAKTCGDGYRRGDPAKGENINDCVWVQKNPRGQLTTEPCSKGADMIGGKCYPACVFGFFRSGTECLPDSVRVDACKKAGGTPRLGNDGILAECRVTPLVNVKTATDATSGRLLDPETGLPMKKPVGFAGMSSNTLLFGGLAFAAVLGVVIYKKRKGAV